MSVLGGRQMAWNAKVKCIKEYNPGKGATAGDIYEIIDGKLTYDKGVQSYRQFENIEQLNYYNKAQFIEVKRRGRPRKR